MAMYYFFSILVLQASTLACRRSSVFKFPWILFISSLIMRLGRYIVLVQIPSASTSALALVLASVSTFSFS